MKSPIHSHTLGHYGKRRFLAFLLPLLMTGFALAAPAAPVERPLEIVSAQFGIFDDSTPGELAFEPSNIIPRTLGQRYGWIIEVQGGKRSLTVQEEYLLALAGKGQPLEETVKDEFLDSFRQAPQRRNQVSQRQLVPVEGRIYGEWSVGPKEPPGKRRLQVYVEGRLAASFEYEMK